MALGYAGALRNIRADETRDYIDAAGSGATLKIYGGTRPITGGAPGGSALVTFILPFPVAPDATLGVSTWNAIAGVNITSSSTAAWFRVEDNSSSQAIDGDVGDVGSGADMELDSTTLVSGRLMTIDSAVITEGNP